MLRITANKSASGALKYFDEGLTKSDYYAEKGEIIGKWGGKSAKDLGLSGEVNKAQFESLCYNKNPETGEQLTARNNENRRVGYDFTFDVPKSVSIIYSQTKDKDILSAFHNAIDQTMQDIEAEAKTRVRTNGKSEDRITGNLVWGKFTHEDARPVNGLPDPHLHQHVFVFNSTYDQVEKKWKAAQFGDIKADGQYFETLYHSRLANNLVDAGYGIERNKNGFEIKGFERSTIDKFSNRTQAINKLAKQMGIKDEKVLNDLGAYTRENKRTGYDKEDIRLQWRSRLSEKELALIHSAKDYQKDNNLAKGRLGFAHAVEKIKKVSPSQALNYALEHTLERKSVVSHKELSIHALKRSYGSVNPVELQKELTNRKDLLSQKQKDGSTIFTTQQAISEEKKLIQTTRKGKNQFDAIHPEYRIKNELLNKEQAGAVKHVLSSKDFITIVSGGAGTGKTWSIKEVAQGLKEKKIPLGAFAPSSAASRQVQRDDGFKNATTIADLLQNEKLQRSVHGGVIWVDEAGMVGNQTMNQVIDIAKKQNARILLTGDVKQHSSVERGDALRIMEQFGGIKPAHISKIQRQKVGDYKQAVKALSNGKIEKGLTTLDQMGAIKESNDFNETRAKVAEEYTKSIQQKENTLIVATTHAQGIAVTETIRDKMKKEGMLKGQEKIFKTQRNLSFTDAQKKDKGNYATGMLVQFHHNTKGGIKRGTKYQVLGKDEKGNVMIKNDQQKQSIILPVQQAKRFSVYQSELTKVAQGDQIRITQNGFSSGRKRLNNGNILTVKGFDKEGNILASTGKREIKLDKNYSNFTHGYYTTSPASQGKSVNRVIILQSSMTGKAASKEQFYVSASRGKFAISIHTDDKQQLFRNVQRSSQRMTAMEVAQKPTGKLVQMKNQLKKMGVIYRTAKSKLATLGKNWNKEKSILSVKTKPQPNYNYGRTKSR